ncbi:MAG: pantetheine-phosphate adenylyltransferase [Firmicutes bacterium]|nr:pantetheine-phosphate adenylyltransferase [Bacillota bacterium]
MTPMRTAIYPGSFDPVTYGHLDLIERATRIFDRVIVAVLRNTDKPGLFSIEERMGLLREACQSFAGVEIDAFDGLLVDYVRSKGADVVVRGLRAVSDFEHELQMALMNRTMAPEVETFFMMTSAGYSFLSSSLVREIASFGGPVHDLVPPHVEVALRRKFQSSL